MPSRLLLDEMFPRAMADRLNAKGHDVRAVVADPEFAGLPDEDVLIGATEAGRALVTANIKDFKPLDARCRAAPGSGSRRGFAAGGHLTVVRPGRNRPTMLV